VESTQVKQAFKDLKLKLKSRLSKNDMRRIGKFLNIDMIVVGTDEYKHVKDTYIKPPYMRWSESAKFIDVSTGEVLISISISRAPIEKFSIRGKMFIWLERELSKFKNKQAE